MQRPRFTSPQWLASLGAAFEYADFVMFVLMAPWLDAAFFPTDSAWAQSLRLVGLFAAGYIARPLGGLVFGSRGDRYGRKTTFVSTTGLMAAATCAIGCLPTHAQIGPSAPALLILLRCLQGFSMGGELPGAMVFVAEHAPPHHRGRACAAVLASVSLGGLLATGLLAALTSILTATRMAEWAWRVPFLVGGSLAIFCRGLRAALEEPPAFLASAPATQPLRVLLQHHAGPMAVGVAVAALSATGTLFPLYAPAYLARLGYAMDAVYATTTAGLAYAVGICGVSGRLVDRFGARHFLATTAALWACAAPVALHTLQVGTPGALVAYTLLWQTGTSALATGYWALLTGAFPVQVRYSALALCSNIAFACCGTLPLLLEPLSHHGPGMMSLPFVALAGLGWWLLRLTPSVKVSPMENAGAKNVI